MYFYGKMLVIPKQIRPLYLFIFSILFIFCIQENESNPSLQLVLVQSQLQVLAKYEIPEIRACLVNTLVFGKMVTTCYEIEKEFCNLDFFNNIKTPVVLQNRRDDLTFISINFPNCASGTAPLFLKYSNLQTPASMIWKDSFGFDGANVESQFQFTNQNSCKDLKLETASFITGGFSRLLNSMELSQLDGVEAELALIPATSAACMNDLNLNTGLISLTQGIKSGALLKGISCAYQSGSGFSICPWSL
ncbi:hypothetical protein LEP1GSC077_3864 [Leptospira interrogans str. C10069]|uniref:Uncharacterized protein n=2 Tax=Leptospiraceae TaxID=170 RepID=M6ZKS8_LEPIR|nr:hypothetical protein LEP1GSC007_0611 [Leptospira interrogans serovar Bulgarica str. Mallika]EKO04670.1 hypothetical protein LEP1GSC077_3864 [Leptospira interrogans str. C10069]EMN61245.1 hypothetical protein LEP1GSC092_3575 [Leptospira interrogans serovar Pyrogenes str. R168]EMP04752.1 hypothetical protein LEP1GSC124_1292 [Leptospira interrogans serovar Pyrogenes str. 200701872]